MNRPLIGAAIASLLAAAPLTAQQQQGSTATPATESKSATPRGRSSWTSDRPTFRVGDIITVLVDERTQASASRNNSAQDERKRALGIDVSQNVSPTGPSPRVDVRATNDGSSRQKGEESRSNRFVGEVSVRVVALGDDGLLQVKGSKTIALDKNSEELTLTGFVRPEDVSPRNVVESWRVADAQLVHKTRGGMSKPKGHLLLRILGVFWP